MNGQVISRTAMVSLRFLNYFSSTMFTVALPVIIISFDKFHQFPEYILFFFFLGQLLSQILFAPLSDYISRRLTLAICLPIFMIGCLICALAPNGDIFILGYAVQGLGIGTVFGLANALLNDYHAELKEGGSNIDTSRMIAYLGLLVNWSFAIGFYIAGVLLLLSWRGIFYFLLAYAGLVLAMLLPFLFRLSESKQTTSKHPLAVARVYVRIASHIKLLSYSLIYALSLAVVYIFYLEANKILSLFHSPFMLATYALMTCAGYVLGKFLSAYIKLPPRFLIFLATLINLLGVAAIWAVFYYIQQDWLIFLCFSVSCFGVGLLSPVCIARPMSFFPGYTNMATNVTILIIYLVTVMALAVAIFIKIDSIYQLGRYLFILTAISVVLSIIYIALHSHFEKMLLSKQQ